MADNEVFYDSEEGEAEFARLEEYIETARADHEEAEVGEAEHEEEGRESESRPQHRSRIAATQPLPTLPPVPEFEPLVQQRHNRVACYPPEFNLNGSALDYFQLFFDNSIFQLLAENTNNYASFKGAGNAGSRPWKSTTPAELKIFFGIIIYMGVFPSSQVSDYWKHDESFPYHRIGMYLSQNRFEQLKRYFHISPPYQHLPRAQWYEKFQPLASLLATKYQSLLVPESEVAVDEMMIQFTGRSVHTTLIRGKPIPQGYKVLALCDHGYTYSFLFTSRADSFAELNSHLYSGPLKLSPTSCAVYQLACTLPINQFFFTIYMDNYFTNILLLKALRDRGIGACGTSRPTSAEYPKEFKFGKKKPSFPLNTISGVIQRDVLVCLWQDNNLVQFMSTVHTITQRPGNYIEKRRRRPRITNSNRQNILRFFGDKPIATLLTPKIAIDYNNHMNAVDLADQYRSYYATQLRVSRVWMPVFFWLLDTSVINAWTLAKISTASSDDPSLPQSHHQNHRNFRIQLAHAFTFSSYQSLNPSRAVELEALVSASPIPPANGRHCPGTVPLGNTHLSRRRGIFSLSTYFYL